MTNYNFCYAITLTGPKQEEDAEKVKTLIGTKILYLLMAKDISANENKHIHMFIRWLTRIAPPIAKAMLGDARESLQYCDMVKNKSGYTNYLTEKRSQGLEVTAHGDVPQGLSTTLSIGGQKIVNTKDDSCEYKLQNNKYKTRQEALEDFRERAAYALTYRKGPLMTAINSKFPISDDRSQYTLDDFTHKPLDFTDNRTKVLVGGTGIGKTQFALAHFNNPLKITHTDDWNRFDPDYHDGAVVDDVAYNKYEPVKFLHIIEMRTSAGVRFLYGNNVIPANFRKIFTINNREKFWPETATKELQKAYKTRAEEFIFPPGQSLFKKKRQRTDNKQTNDTVRNRHTDKRHITLTI